jgi:uncharacterized RDD family membrane protein YckC
MVLCSVKKVACSWLVCTCCTYCKQRCNLHVVTRVAEKLPTAGARTLIMTVLKDLILLVLNSAVFLLAFIVIMNIMDICRI